MSQFTKQYTGFDESSKDRVPKVICIVGVSSISVVCKRRYHTVVRASTHIRPITKTCRRPSKFVNVSCSIITQLFVGMIASRRRRRLFQPVWACPDRRDRIKGSHFAVKASLLKRFVHSRVAQSVVALLLALSLPSLHFDLPSLSSS